MYPGTPPYFPVNEGAVPPDKESAACLFEYRGGVEAYCLSAASRLASCASRFVVCDTSLAIDRVDAAAAGAGLVILRRLDVIPKTGKPPLFSVWVMRLRDPVGVCAASTSREGDISAESESHEKITAEISACAGGTAADGGKMALVLSAQPAYLVDCITVRDAAGHHTDQYKTLLIEMGKLSMDAPDAAVVPTTE